MTPFEILKSNNLLNWNTVTIGYKRGWCKKSDAIEYAEHCVSLSEEQIKYPLIDIVTGENASNTEFAILLDDISKQDDSIEGNELLLLRWRYALLKSIMENSSRDQDKRLLVEDIYSEFEHPEDMADLSIYSNSGIDKLQGAKCLIDELYAKVQKD